MLQVPFKKGLKRYTAHFNLKIIFLIYFELVQLNANKERKKKDYGRKKINSNLTIKSENFILP